MIQRLMVDGDIEISEEVSDVIRRHISSPSPAPSDITLEKVRQIADELAAAFPQGGWRLSQQLSELYAYAVMESDLRPKDLSWLSCQCGGNLNGAAAKLAARKRRMLVA